MSLGFHLLWAGRHSPEPWESLSADYRRRIEPWVPIREQAIRVSTGGEDRARRRLEGEALLARVAELGIEVRNPDAAFIEAVAAGTPAYPAFADALRAHVVAAALYRSAADPTNPGIPVPVPAGRPDPSWPAAPT